MGHELVELSLLERFLVEDICIYVYITCIHVYTCMYVCMYVCR